MQKNDVIDVVIDDIGIDGQGIGKHEGLTIFVQGALPEEIVRTKIIKLKKNYAVGKRLDILKQSPMRTDPLCNVFDRCGGCTLQHLAYAAQLEFKQKYVQDCINRIAGLDIEALFPIPSQHQYRYRNKAAFPVRMREGKLSIGMYKAYSHDVVDVDDCKIQPGDMAIALSQLRVWIVKYNISVYDEQLHTGLLRHVVLRANKQRDMMMILVINGQDIPCKKELLSLFQFILPQLKHVVINRNTQKTNVILGDTSTTILGTGYMYETVCGLDLRLSPVSFMQVNTDQMNVLYKNLLKMLDISQEQVLLDLYCGSGAIALCLAPHVRKVYGIELSKEAVENAKFNAKFNDIENAKFFAGDVQEILQKDIGGEARADIVIVDPPRKGLTEPLIQTIADAGPIKIGYVSCDPATFARDLEVFDSLGYAAHSVQPVDMFPQTTGVEVIAVLEQR